MPRHLRHGLPFVCLAFVSCLTPEDAISDGANISAGIARSAAFSAMSLNVKWNDGVSNSYAERAGCMSELVIAAQADILGIQEIRSDMAPEAVFWSALSSAARRAQLSFGRFAGQVRSAACPPTEDCQALACEAEACDELDVSREQLPIYWNRARFALIRGGVHKIDGETSPYARSLSWVELADRLSGHGIAVYNVHVDHFKDGQAHQIARIAEVIAQNGHDRGPLIVLGDFNVDSTTKVGAQKLAPLFDVLKLRPANDPGLGTLHGFSGRAKKGAIDYLFHSDALTAEPAVLYDAPSASCPQSVENCADEGSLGRLCEEPNSFVTNGYPSDHYALSARFVVP